MEEERLIQKIDELGRKIDATYASIEKTRKYFLWFLILSLLALFLPLFGMVIALPYFMSLLTRSLPTGL